MDVINILIEWFPYLIMGIVATLVLVISSLVIGLIFGLPMAIGQVYGSPLIKKIIGIYVWIFRGLPVLVLLFIFWLSVFPLLEAAIGSIFPGMNNIQTPAIIVGILVLGLRGAAYQSQIFRGALQSIDEGQMTAARSIGMTTKIAIISIIVPQAMRIALPGWSNEYPNVLTDSAVCYAIGVAELLTRTQQIVSQTYVVIPLYIACALIYIALNYSGVIFLHRLEKKIEIPGFSYGV